MGTKIPQNPLPDRMSSKLPPSPPKKNEYINDLKVTKEPILHVDCTPDDKYPLRILEAYRENCNVCWQADGQIDNKICDIMNAHCEQRAVILDKAIAILKGHSNNEKEQIMRQEKEQ